MALDWALASLHHLAVFSLVAIVAYEIAMTSGVVDAAMTGRIAAGGRLVRESAAAVVAAGIARVFLGEKGPAYYGANSLFWAKMAVFAGVAGCPSCRRCNSCAGGARRGATPTSNPDRSRSGW